MRITRRRLVLIISIVCNVTAIVRRMTPKSLCILMDFLSRPMVLLWPLVSSAVASLMVPEQP